MKWGKWKEEGRRKDYLCTAAMAGEFDASYGIIKIERKRERKEEREEKERRQRGEREEKGERGEREERDRQRSKSSSNVRR